MSGNKQAPRHVALALFLAGLLVTLGLVPVGPTPVATASGTDFMVNNEVLRFGGGGHNGTTYTYTDSIADSGMPEQPFYKNADGVWRKLTYSNIPLSMTLGSGTGGSNWSGATVIPGTDYIGITSLSGLSVDSSGMTARSPAQAVPYGYGTLLVSGTVDLNGSSVEIQHRYELGETNSYVKATTTVRNTTASAIQNVVIWVGTRDDWVGDTDGPTKTRGNIVNGAFTAISNQADPSKAIKIQTDREAVLFYSTTEGTGTSIDDCCSFDNAYDVDPEASPITLTGDGSYSISLPVGTLDANGSASIVWFYAGGTLAEIDNIIQAVASAAAPAAPTVTRSSGQVQLDWAAINPPSGQEIVRYEYSYRAESGGAWGAWGSEVSTVLNRTATITGLSNSTKYEFRVRAVTRPTGGGADVLGSWSASSTAEILGAPDGPTLSSVTGGDATLALAIVEPASPISPITGYEYSLDNGVTWTAANAPVSGVITATAGVANGNSYNVRVRAVNIHGASIASSSVTAVTNPVWSTTTISNWNKGTFRTQTLSASSSVTYSLTSGSLPTGLILNPSTGALSGTSSAGGEYTVTITATNAAGSAAREFTFRVVPYWNPSQTAFSVNVGASASQFIASTDAVGLDLSSGATATVTNLPSGMTFTVEGGSTANTAPRLVFTGAPDTIGTFTATVTITDSSNRTVSTPVVFTISAAPPPPEQTQTVTRIPVPQTVAPRRIVIPPQGPVQAPILQNNQVSSPPVTPQALVNGVPTTLSTLVTDPNNLNLRTGVLNIGVSVQSDQGLVRQGTQGETEVQVRKGGVAGFQGTGLAPRSFVQVFMPLQGTNAKELARIPVDEAGTFNGEATFATSFQEAPLPVGRQVLQMVTVDEQGRQNVVEITVNIVQPPPSPEPNREAGVTPQLRPGQSLATNAGVPEVVDVTVIPDQKQTIIEGNGWTMSIAPQDENSNVTENEDGEVLLELVRDESATVAGSGFMPNTRADVWLFSDPTLLGTVDIDENGEFNGTVNIDGQAVNVGEHTLQLQGIGTDGYVRAANLGVVVNDAEAAQSTEDAAGGFLWWWLLILLAIAIAVAVYVWWKRRKAEEAL